MASIPSIYDIGLPPWLVFGAALGVWVVLLWLTTRLLYRTRERLRCPVKGREASVVFMRAPDGFREDVIRCSLLDEEPGSTCARQCLHAAHG